MRIHRRAVISGAAAGGVGILHGPSSQAAAPPGPPARPQSERRGYADGPLGQTHFRVMGEGPTILLLHETPWSSGQYARVQPLLAAAGFRAVAADTSGYGMSPAPAHQPRLEAYADQMFAVLDALGARRAIVAGDHTGAALAILMGARRPERLRAISLYGVPLYTPEQRADRLKDFEARYAPPLVIKEDGSHLSDRFRFARNVMTGRVGSLEGVQDSTVAYMVAGDRKQMVLRALFEHPSLEASLARLRGPGLLLYSADDSLARGTARAHALRPDFRYVDLGGGGPQLTYDRPDAWTGAVLDFLSASRLRPA